MKKLSKLSLIVFAGTLTLTGCSSNDDTVSKKDNSKTTTSKPAAPMVNISSSIKSNAVIDSDLPAAGQTVQAANGVISKVELINLNEKKKDSKTTIKKDSDSKYSLRGLLKPGTKYSLNITAKNADNKVKKETVNFSTKSPTAFNNYTVYPYGGKTVGVGMPITVTFNYNVVNKKTVQNHFSVTTNNNTKGSWGWIDDKTVVWKPNAFWKSGTKVNVHLDTDGMNLGDGYYGRQDVTTDFSIGRKLEVDVSNETKTATVKVNDKKIKSFPVSLGKPGHSTSSGWNIIYEKDNIVRMKGEDYDEMVSWAQRYNATGEYLHSAPWSVWAQGNTNVSHGCVNIGPNNAIWLYKQTILGDLVHIIGTTENADKWDGMGALWNYSQKEWDSFSAK